MNPELVVDRECHTGEGPLWHPEDRTLYWTDIPRAQLLAYDPSTNEHSVATTVSPVRSFTIERDGALLLFKQDGAISRWDGEAETTVKGPDPARPFNDVIADPNGRVYCGLLRTDDRPGRLVRLEKDRSLTPVDDGFSLPNGMGFSPDRTRLYFADSRGNVIYVYQHDREAGALTDREVFVDTAAERGRPDGLTVDSDGAVWSARWAGGCLVRYDPSGSPMDVIDVPATNVTSVTFGGRDYDTAYVTTALAPVAEPVGTRDEQGSWAGGVFAINPTTGGRPDFRSDIGP